MKVIFILIMLVLIGKLNCNYIFEFREVSVLVKNSTFVDFDFKLKKTSRNETRKLFGNIVQHEDATRDLGILGELYEKQGGEFRKTVYTCKQKACDAIETDNVFWPSMAASVTPQLPLKCDIPAGSWHLEGYQPDMSNVPPHLRTGDYMGLFQVIHKGEIAQAVEVYFHIINIKGGQLGL